jgi:hypothetical protein
VKDIAEVQAAWLAGFYEGEGSFHMGAKSGGKYKQLMVQIAQHDHECPETLTRLVEWTGFGRIYGPYRSNGFHTRLDRPLKDRWFWQLSGERDVRAFFDATRPWLSAWRCEQIDRVLADWSAYRGTLKYPNKGFKKPDQT